jgi:DHA2 family multidrug resistance protein-like MFS transporter
VGFAAFLSMLDFSATNAALPSIAREFSVTPSTALWATSAYLSSSLVALMPLAALADRVGFAAMTRVGLLLLVLSAVGCAMSGGIVAFIAWRLVQGLGGACIMSVNAAHLRKIYPHRTLGRGIAFNTMMVSLGVAAGPTLAAIATGCGSWRLMFLLISVLGAMALGIALHGLQSDDHRVASGKYDAVGAVLSGAVLISGLFTCNRIAHAPFAVENILLVMGVIAGFMLLARQQRQRAIPIVPLDLLGRPDFSRPFVSNLLVFAATTILVIWLPFEVAERADLEPFAIGLVLTIWPVGIIAAVPFVGHLADRELNRFSFIAGISLLVSGAALLMLLGPQQSYLQIIWRVAIAAFGFGLFLTPNNRLLVLAGGHRRSSTSAMVSLARLLGQAIGAAIVLAVFRLDPLHGGTTCLTMTCVLSLAAVPVGLPRRGQNPAACSFEPSAQS